MTGASSESSRPGWGSVDGPLYRLCKTISVYLMAGPMWAIACIPIVTIPPATAVLHAAIGNYHQTGDVPKIRDLWTLARACLAASYGLVMVLTTPFAVLAVDVLIVGNSHQPVLLGGVIGLSVIVVVLLSQAWPALLATTSVRGAILTSARSAIRNPALALAAGCTWAIPWLTLRLVPSQWTLLALVFLPAGCAGLSMHIARLTGAGPARGDGNRLSGAEMSGADLSWADGEPAARRTFPAGVDRSRRASSPQPMQVRPRTARADAREWA